LFTVLGDKQQLADCVEKVGPSRHPSYWLLKMPFFRAATRNLGPEPSAQSKDFNLKRVLFCCGNRGRLFQHNRPVADGGQSDGKSVVGMISFTSTAALQNAKRA
jgi:hypothetical protein